MSEDKILIKTNKQSIIKTGMDKVIAYEPSNDDKCEICNDNKRDLIFDEQTEEQICTYCYYNRYGLIKLLDGYSPILKRKGAI